MYVVYLAVHLDHFGFEVTANLGEDGTKAVDGIGVKYVFPVFCHEDQMDMKLRNTVSPVSYLA
jgi:hypothetical protein